MLFYGSAVFAYLPGVTLVTLSCSHGVVSFKEELYVSDSPPPKEAPIKWPDWRRLDRSKAPPKTGQPFLEGVEIRPMPPGPVCPDDVRKG